MRLLERTDQNALTVPAAALQRGPDGMFVYVVQPDSTVSMQPVEVANNSESVAIVTKGLKAGQSVAITNLFRLQPGGARASAPRPEHAAPARLMSISAPFIRRPVATSLLMAGILLVGIVAFPMLPVAPLPQVDFPTISVSASLPGASPETMASAVATPIEYQFMAIPGVTQLTSQSVLGSTSITVQFDLNRNIDAAAQDVQAAIDAAAGQLPKDLPARPPTGRPTRPIRRS